MHYWVSCAINKGGFLEIAFVSTHICLALAIAFVLPHFDALTHVVIRVSSAFISFKVRPCSTFAEVCYLSIVKRTYFKKFAEGLLSICVY